ncbi:MAG: hypothetical protein KatS3mg132_113 [Limisphaera sp.]|nr:MAG: hypothetical protein KatS3mg132_113 [Limisphaera sp.]
MMQVVAVLQTRFLLKPVWLGRSQGVGGGSQPPSRALTHWTKTRSRLTNLPC